MNPSFKLQGAGTRWVCFALGLLLAMITAVASQADGLLKAGNWTGRYLPPKSGDLISAKFKVKKKDENGAEEWKIFMSLNLPPPANRQRKFSDIVERKTSKDRELRFVLDMNPQLSCRLRATDLGELTGLCYEKKWGEGPSAVIRMKPPAEDE